MKYKVCTSFLDNHSGRCPRDIESENAVLAAIKYSEIMCEEEGQERVTVDDETGNRIHVIVKIEIVKKFSGVIEDERSTNDAPRST